VVVAIELQVPSSDAASTAFNFCLSNITLY
jgi:hypothetical protein